MGGDILSEKSLKEKLPQCRFVGVDPSAHINKHLIEKELGGLFINKAIGANTKALTLIRDCILFYFLNHFHS